MHTGTLIAIEGIDGSGKSTIARALYDHFVGKNRPVILTKEPGGTPLGITLRSILQHRSVPLCARAEYLLFAADRAQHMEEVIKPALQAGTIVISDRMADSSLAYQGYGRGMDCDAINKINAWAMDNVKPDIVIFVRVAVSTAQERTRARNESLTAFEQEHVSFMERVADGFETIFKMRNNVIIVDGNQELSHVISDACTEIDTWMDTQ